MDHYGVLLRRILLRSRKGPFDFSFCGMLSQKKGLPADLGMRDGDTKT